MSVVPRGWAKVRLGEVCEFRYGKSLPAEKREAGTVRVFGSNGPVGVHTAAITRGPTIIIGRKGSFGEVAYSEAGCWPIDTTYYVDEASTSADLRWLSYRLRALGLTGMNRAAAVPGLNREDAYRLELLLPPRDEQRRIAEVLHRADAVRAKRQAALALLDALEESAFRESFGDPELNPHGWPSEPLAAILQMPLRNGLSPATAGTVDGRVLTLSAVTGGVFKGDAVKNARFTETPGAHHLVDARDFLICRGNGNAGLVGKGVFPTASMPDTTFPDTVIAARINPAKALPAFIRAVWNSRSVRRQIESSARTTNGTFKINQGSLEKIRIVVPPIGSQERFTEHVAVLGGVRQSQRRHLAELDMLFEALRDRAFRGEL